MRIRTSLVPISAAIAVASLAGVAISQTESPAEDPTVGLDLENRPRGDTSREIAVPDRTSAWGPAPQAGNFPTSLAEGCTLEGKLPSTLDAKGQEDFSKIPRWIRVLGQDANGVPGPRGCVARELLYPMFDAGAAFNRLARQAGVQSPPLPVFAPDGTLAGYVQRRFRLVEQAIAEGSLPQAFIDRPPVPQDIEPNA